MIDVTNFIPQVAAAKVALAMGLCAALFSGGLYLGHKWGSKALPEAVIESQRHLLEKQAERNEVTAEATVKYVDRIVKVREEAKVIIQEVPVYVKDTCTLSPGVRLLHDAAAQGHFPDPQRVNDEGTAEAQDTPR